MGFALWRNDHEEILCRAGRRSDHGNEYRLRSTTGFGAHRADGGGGNDPFHEQSQPGRERLRRSGWNRDIRQAGRSEHHGESPGARHRARLAGVAARGHGRRQEPVRHPESRRAHVHIHVESALSVRHSTYPAAVATSLWKGYLYEPKRV